MPDQQALPFASLAPRAGIGAPIKVKQLTGPSDADIVRPAARSRPRDLKERS